jgi:hypothetical protein
VAPGQVFDVIVRSQTEIPSAKASGPEWPESLSGVQVKVLVYVGLREFYPARIGSITEYGRIDRTTLYSIRVQFPFELTYVPSISSIPTFQLTLAIFRGNVELDYAHVVADMDSIHLDTVCDGFPANPRSPFLFFPARSDHAATCPVIFRFGSGGDIVSAARPARPGDRLSVLARGLGVTDPPSVTGQPFKEGLSVAYPPVRPSMLMAVDYATNAAPRLAFPPEVTEHRPPISVTPVAGTVGQYRIEFLVPPLPLDRTLPRCDQRTSILTNATVNFYGIASSSGGGFCVDPSER